MRIRNRVVLINNDGDGKRKKYEENSPEVQVSNPFNKVVLNSEALQFFKSGSNSYKYSNSTSLN